MVPALAVGSKSVLLSTERRRQTQVYVLRWKLSVSRASPLWEEATVSGWCPHASCWLRTGSGYNPAGSAIWPPTCNYQMENNKDCVVSEPRGPASIWECGVGRKREHSIWLLESEMDPKSLNMSSLYPSLGSCRTPQQWCW